MHATICMHIENIVLNETSQTKKNKYCIIPFIQGTWNKHIYRDIKHNKKQFPEVGEKGELEVIV